MNKLIRAYNQNRALVIATVFIIALIIIIIQILNSYIKQENEAKLQNIKNNENSSTNFNSTTISPSNVSVVTGKTVKTNKEDKEAIKQFVEYCNKKEIEKAYNMLTQDCKKLMYQNIDKFREEYVNKIFYINRMYTLENWYGTNEYSTYYIKYIEDILATGNVNSKDNIGDYITTTTIENKTYLNISSFIGSKNINKQEKKENITIDIGKMYMYMDYTILDIKVKNNTNRIISIDTKENVDTMYLYDENKVKYIALLNENSKEELEIRKGMEKNIKIKFNKMYNPEGRELRGIILEDIVTNYENYTQAVENKNTITVNVKI